MSLLFLFAPTAWAPSQLSSLKGWWKGNELTATPVTSWPDASGTGNTAATVGADPDLLSAHLDSKNVVDFTAAPDHLFLPSGAVSAFTEGAIFYVAIADSGSTMAVPVDRFGTDGSGLDLYASDGSVRSGFLSSAIKNIGTPGGTTSWHIGAFLSKASDWRARWNGAEIYTTGTNTVGAPAGAPSFGYNGNGDPFDGKIAEVVLLNAFPTADDAERIEGYLAWKWGLEGTLDVGHTYKSEPPTIAAAQTAAAGNATETDTATSLARLAIRGVGLAAGANTAFALAAKSVRAAGLAAEADGAFRLGAGMGTGRSNETDTASALGRAVSAGLATEADTASALGAAAAQAVVAAIESDSASALASVGIRATGLSAETDAAQGLGAKAIAALGQASETDAAQALAPLGAQTVGNATETDDSLALGAALALGLADEADTAFALAATAIAAAGLAAETDAAFSLAQETDEEPVGLASETDQALALGRIATLALGQAEEADVALQLAPVAAQAVGAANDNETAFALYPFAIGQTGRADEIDTATARTGPRAPVPPSRTSSADPRLSTLTGGMSGGTATDARLTTFTPRRAA